MECRIKTVTSKAETVVNPKLIDQRFLEEAAFLDDLVSWLIHSGTAGTDEAFSYRRVDGGIAVLTGRRIREELKRTCEANESSFREAIVAEGRICSTCALLLGFSMLTGLVLSRNRTCCSLLENPRSSCHGPASLPLWYPWLTCV